MRKIRHVSDTVSHLTEIRDTKTSESELRDKRMQNPIAGIPEGYNGLLFLKLKQKQ